MSGLVMARLTCLICVNVCIAGNTLVLHGGLFRKPSPPGQGTARGRKRRRIPFTAAGPLQPGNLSDLVAASMPQLSLGLGFGVQTLESIAFATRGASANIQQDDDAMWALRRPEPSCALLHGRLAGLCRAVDSCTFAAWCPLQVCGTWYLLRPCRARSPPASRHPARCHCSRARFASGPLLPAD